MCELAIQDIDKRGIRVTSWDNFQVLYAFGISGKARKIGAKHKTPSKSLYMLTKLVYYETNELNN